jgi:hypothetical protein
LSGAGRIENPEALLEPCSSPAQALQQKTQELPGGQFLRTTRRQRCVSRDERELTKVGESSHRKMLRTRTNTYRARRDRAYPRDIGSSKTEHNTNTRYPSDLQCRNPSHAITAVIPHFRFSHQSPILSNCQPKEQQPIQGCAALANVHHLISNSRLTTHTGEGAGELSTIIPPPIESDRH